MAFYIQIENGQPIGHPYLEENILDVHGQIPFNFQPFIHKDKPDIEFGIYQKQQKTYGLAPDGVSWTEIFTAIDMTEEEKTAEMNYINRILDLKLKILIDNADHMISQISDQSQINVWNTYKEVVNSTVKTEDPIDVLLPVLPKKVNGVFTENRDINNVWKTTTYPWP